MSFLWACAPIRFGWMVWLVMDAHIGEGGPPPAWVDFSGSFYCGLPHFTVIGLDLEPQFYSLSLLWVCFSWFLFRFGFHCASKTMNYRVPCHRICLFSLFLLFPYFFFYGLSFGAFLGLDIFSF